MQQEPNYQRRRSTSSALAFGDNGIARLAASFLLRSPDLGHNLVPAGLLAVRHWFELADYLAVAGDIERLAFGDFVEDGAGFVMQLPGVKQWHDENVTHMMLHVNLSVEEIPGE